MNILFFTPYYSMWNTTLIENMFMEELSKNYKITVLYCDGFMSNICIAQDSEHKNIFTSKKEKLKTCKNCKKNFNSLKKNPNIDYIKIDKFISKDILSEIENLNLEKKSNSDLLNFRSENINIGKLTLYELSLKKKKINLSIEGNEERIEVIEKIKQILIFNYILKQINKSIKIDFAATTNGYYYINKFFINFLKNINIKTIILNNSPNFKYSRTRLKIGIESEYYDKSLVLKDYDKFKTSSLLKSTVDEALDSVQIHMKNKHSHVFSPKMKKNINIRDIFKIDENKKIVLVVLSSQSEIYSALNILSYDLPKTLFKDQLDFIKFFLEISNSFDDYHFIIRTHPRQYIDFLAPEIEEFNKIEFKNYPNVSLNTPADNLSIFNFIKDTNFIINTWSTTAVQFGMFGIENITIFPEHVFYPKECMNFITEKKDLKNKILNVKNRNITNSINFLKYLQIQESTAINFDNIFKYSSSISLLNSSIIDKFFFKYIYIKIWSHLRKSKINKIDQQAINDFCNQKYKSYAESKFNSFKKNKFFDNKDLIISNDLLKKRINEFTDKYFSFLNF
jgi:vacuolar-type H+-ATPase subunit F/Vma7